MNVIGKVSECQKIKKNGMTYLLERMEFRGVFRPFFLYVFAGWRLQSRCYFALAFLLLLHIAIYRKYTFIHIFSQEQPRNNMPRLVNGTIYPLQSTYYYRTARTRKSSTQKKTSDEEKKKAFPSSLQVTHSCYLINVYTPSSYLSQSKNDMNKGKQNKKVVSEKVTRLLAFPFHLVFSTSKLSQKSKTIELNKRINKANSQYRLSQACTDY